MRLGLISAASGVRTPPSIYGGIEKWTANLATALVQRGHAVTVFGQIDEPKAKALGWKWVQLEDEYAIFKHIDELKTFDLIHDNSHMKVVRLFSLPHYVATTMFTDSNAMFGRDIYPSKAVAQAFGEPNGPVIPLGLDTASMAPLADFPDDSPYVVLGRVMQIKGQDIAIRLLSQLQPVPPSLVVGHTGAFSGDQYYPLCIQKMCKETDIPLLANPTDAEIVALLQRSRGALHLHRWLESFGLAPAEALCYGVPILTTDQGAPQEYVRELDAGFVTPLAKLEKGEFTDPVIQAFFNAKWDRKGIAARARKYFDSNRIAEIYEKVYEGIGK